MTAREFLDYAARCKAALIDVDGTALDGNASEGIGGHYLKREMKRGNYRNVGIGVVGGLWTLYYQMIRGDDDCALAEFIGALNRAGCVDKETAKEFAGKYVKKHIYPGLKELAAYLQMKGLRTIVHTSGLDVSAAAVKDEIGAEESFGNYTVSGNRIVPSEHATNHVPYKAATARHYLTERNIVLPDCLVFGDSESDLPLMEEAKMSLASPKAKRKVRKKADLYVPDYRIFLPYLNA